MEAFHADGSENWPCEVVIQEGRIAVSYTGDDGYVTYTGSEVEPGHFRLTSKDVSGQATLHRFNDTETLEGGWIEDGYRGMWTIDLDDGRED